MSNVYEQHKQFNMKMKKDQTLLEKSLWHRKGHKEKSVGKVKKEKKILIVNKAKSLLQTDMIKK